MRIKRIFNMFIIGPIALVLMIPITILWSIMSACIAFMDWEYDLSWKESFKKSFHMIW